MGRALPALRAACLPLAHVQLVQARGHRPIPARQHSTGACRWPSPWAAGRI